MVRLLCQFGHMKERTAYFDSIEQFGADCGYAFEELSYFVRISSIISLFGMAIGKQKEGDIRLEAPSITSPHPFTSTSTPLFWLRSCRLPRRGYMTSSAGLKITNGLSSSSCALILVSVSEGYGFEEGKRVESSSKSRASVLGYFERSSVGAN